MKKALVISGKSILSVIALVVSMIVSMLIVEWLYPEVPENLADLVTFIFLGSGFWGMSLVAIWNR